MAAQRDVTQRKQARRRSFPERHLTLDLEIKTRNEQLAALRRIVQVVTQSLDLNLVANLALEETVKVLRLDAGVIRYVDEASGDVVLLAHYGLPPEMTREVESLKHLPAGEGLSGIVTRSGQPLIVEDLSAETRMLLLTAAPAGFQSLVGLPLQFKDRVVGVINGFSREKRGYASMDMEMLVSLGNLVGMAIENSRVHSELERLNLDLQRVAQKRGAMNRITAAISPAMGLDSVYRTLHTELPALVSFDRLSISLLKGDRIEVYAASEEFGPQVSIVDGSSSANSLFARVLVTGKPTVRSGLSEINGHPGDCSVITARGSSCILIPLVLGRRTIGSLNLLSRQENSYSEADLDYLQPVADRVAVSLENARLFNLTDEKLRRRIGELEALTGVINASSGSLNLRTILDKAVVVACKAMGMEMATISLLEEDGETVTTAAVHNWPPDSPVRVGLERKISSLPSAAKAAATREPVIVDNIRNQEKYPEFDIARAAGLISIITVPLIYSGQTIGLMNLWTASFEKSFSVEEVNLARAIAGHLATLIENARLHGNTEMERSTLEAILASIGEGLVVVNYRQTVIYCNKAAEKLLRLDSSAIVNQPVETFYEQLSKQVIEPRDWRERLRGQFKDEVEDARTHYVIRSPERKELEAIMFVIRNQGQLLGTGAVLRDVTHQREVDRLKTAFISMASHELRTPMTSIMGFSELLLRSSGLDQTERECARWINKESIRLSNIVDDLLNVSRIELGRLSLTLLPVDPQAVAAKTLHQISGRYAGRQFRTSFPPGFPPVLADAEKLEQVLYNLADNASKHSPEGGEVTIAGHQEEGQETVILTVADSGPGIPPEEITRLFTRFHRIHRPDAQTTRGTGLGLYIVKSLVEMMNGKVWVESTVGRGSTFYVSLPAARNTHAAPF